MHSYFQLIPILLSCATFCASAAVHYVNAANPAAASPYATWATAAATIQDAVDVAAIGDQILVTNGVYNVGARVVDGAISNRVAVSKQVAIQSINGPNVTTIQGYQVPGATNGDSAIRCVYLTNGAALIGFTLTNGATRASGTLSEYLGGGVYFASGGLLSNCVIAGNSALNGGGAYNGTLANCLLAGNSAFSGGGGADDCILNNCTLSNNRASSNGGGADMCVLYNCTLTENSASYGGGAYYCTLANCVLSGNSATVAGGGLYGQGAISFTVNNCTITGNRAAIGGGVAENNGIIYNSILYFNSADLSPNYQSDSLNNCCTTPLPSNGNNISADPQLASPSHLSVGSPCRAAGISYFARGVDIDGEPWASPPSIGCDEFYPGKTTGTLYPSIETFDTNVTVGIAANFVANIIGQAGASAWDFSDGILVSNRPYASHVWTKAGDYTVTLRAYNDSWPGGVTSLIAVHAAAPRVHYVSLSSGSPQPPYATWTTAATNIQDAVDAAQAGDTVLVSNGVYAVGSRVVYGLLSNRVAVTEPVAVQSLNGPAVTVIQGYQMSGTINGDSAVRCVYLGSGAALVGFTVTNGATRALGDRVFEQSGGGVWCSTSALVSDCVIAGNESSVDGGGAYNGTLANCIIVDNAAAHGGGVNSGTLNNCSLAGNSAWIDGGGSYGCSLNNCIAYYNTAPTNSNYVVSVLSYCCTIPAPEIGAGNFTNAPLFADPYEGNLRLEASSPCINAGLNTYTSSTLDLDGNPRIVGGTVDVGAYEFQTPASILSYAWLQQYGLPTDGSADFIDSDGDRMMNWQEWIAGTNPTNAESVLRMLPPTNTVIGPKLSWTSVTDRTYSIERATDPYDAPAFSLLQSNIAGLEGITAYTDTNTFGGKPFLYRVRVTR